MSKKLHWCGEVPEFDTFGIEIKDAFIDGKTKYGPWAIMAVGNSWATNGCGKLGVGCGQRYEKQADGLWLKTEG